MRHTIDRIASFPINEIDLHSTERYVSTGRLTSERNGSTVSLARFTIGELSDFEEFIKVFNSYKETGTAKIPDEKTGA